MIKNKRHNHYINPAIQKRLMISLVIAELVLITLALLWLYIDLDQLIENNMFKIHILNTLSAEFVITRLTKAAVVLLAVNILIASAIVRYWKNYITQIVAPLVEVSNAIQQLDFTVTPQIGVPHEAADIAIQWLRREKKHLLQIRQCIETLDIDKPEDMSKIMQTCQHLLKQCD